MSFKRFSNIWAKIRGSFWGSFGKTASPFSSEDLPLSDSSEQEPSPSMNSISTTTESNTIFAPTIPGLLFEAAKVSESEWEGILLFGLQKIPNEDGKFRVHRLVYGDETAVHFCVQTAVRLAKLRLEEIDFRRDLDHHDKTKH